MNTKLLLFVVLICFPSQSVDASVKFSGLGKAFGKLGDLLSGINEVCSFVDTISGGKYNCSSVTRPGVSFAANTDGTMPDVSADKFFIDLFVGGGTTPQNVSLILDTTLDYTFMLCQQCTDSCSTNLPVYDPSLSNTYSNYTCINSECPSQNDATISCSGGYCTYNYSNYGVSSDGSLVNDTFNFDTSPFPFVFGCGDVNTGNYGSSLGFLGLGSGGLSLLSQVDYKKFSYCFGSSGDGAFLLGSSAQLSSNSGASTDLLNNKIVPMYYYVNFTGVSLGGQHIDIPTSNYLPQPDGTGGMLLTSTYPLTYLENSAYNALKDAFVKQMSSFSQVNGSEFGLDLCFTIPAGQQMTFPQLTLHFDDGADMNPYSYSYFGSFSNETVSCLLLLPLEGISVLGYMMQLDMQIIYDVSNGTLLFEKTDCGSLI